jgi:hypothetical protein
MKTFKGKKNKRIVRRFNMKVKGQTAMEYLMTYGWAILIVIVVVAALYSMGVFTLKGGVPCSPCFSNFAFVDYSQSAGTLRVRNGPKTISIASGGVTSSPTGATTSACPVSTPCEAGADIDITNVPTTAGASIQISINYTDTASGLPHQETATLHNK